MNIRTQVQNKLTQVIFTLKDTLLHVSIRLGKTKIALDAIESGDKVLWLYPSNAMMSGYQEDLIKFPPKSMDITFMNISSIKKIKNTYWDYIICDEPQKMKSKIQLTTLKTLTYRKRIGLSGTMNAKTLKLLQEELKWTVGATYSLEDGIRDGIVKDYKVYIYFSNLCNNIKSIEVKKFGKLTKVTESEAYDSYCKTMDYFKAKQSQAVLDGDWNAAKQAKFGIIKYMGLRTNLLYNSTCLLNAAEELVYQFRNQKALIYALRTDVADTLSSKTFHSKNKDEDSLEWFRTSEEGHLGVVDCVTTGITIKNLNTTIFHSYNSNTETFHQKLGRALLYEHIGECANVHVCTLKDTQNEKWIESATSSLELDKIYYVIDGVTDTKLNWLIKWHPEKSIYIVKKSGALVYYNGWDESGENRLYSYLSQYKKPDTNKEIIPIKAYPFKDHNLNQVI